MVTYDIGPDLGIAWAELTYSAMHEQEGTIQLFAAAKCQYC